jgi:phosphatidylglycerol:prolipoprotein diacylglycerol transferase
MLQGILNTIGTVLNSFGLVLVLALIIGSFVFWKKGREEHYDENELLDLTLMSVLWGLVGARLAHILFHFEDFGLNVLYWVSFWSRPGLHWFGLFLAGLVFFVRFCQKNKWNVYETLDLAVIGIALSQAVVHIGMFLGGSGIGKVTNLPIGYHFAGIFERRHPIGVYGGILWFLVFLFLWWVEGKYRRFEWYQRYKGDSKPGFLVFSYVIALGLVGAILTVLSESVTVVFGLNVDLALRISLLIVGILGLVSRSGIGGKIGLDELFMLRGKKR